MGYPGLKQSKPSEVDLTGLRETREIRTRVKGVKCPSYRELLTEFT